MTVREIAPRLASAFGDYRPETEFEKQAIVVLDELLRTVQQLARDVRDLSGKVGVLAGDVDGLSRKVDHSTENANSVRTRMIELSDRIDQTVARMEVLAQDAALSAAAARDSAVHSERSSTLLDEERRAAHRLGLEGLPLASLETPEERKTDPNMIRPSTAPSGDPPPDPDRPQ